MGQLVSNGLGIGPAAGETDDVEVLEAVGIGEFFYLVGPVCELAAWQTGGAAVAGPVKAKPTEVEVL